MDTPPPPPTESDVPILVLYNLDHEWQPAEKEEVLDEVARVEAAVRAEGHSVTSLRVDDADLDARLAGYSPDDWVVLNWCEDLPGISQGDVVAAQILEQRGMTYTGATSQVLALSWDKSRVKERLRTARVPLARGRIYETPDPGGWDCFPAIVKPSRQHCSFGVTPEAVVLTPAELRERIAFVLDTFHQPALVEDFIDGREFHVTVWGNGTLEMMPPAEMDFGVFENIHDRLCTFDSKFQPGSIHYTGIQLRMPASLSEAEHARLEQIARRAYRAIGCRDYARLDIRLRDGTFHVLDVNPNADLSHDNSMTHAAKLLGYSYGAMVSRLIRLAAHRHPIFSQA